MFRFTFIIALFTSALQLNAQQVNAKFSHKVFYSAPTFYFETYLSFDPGDLEYKLNENNKPQARLAIVQVLRKGETIIDFKKYEIKSPEPKDSALYHFIDQQRFVVDTGSYELDIELTDLNISDSLNQKESKLTVPIKITQQRNEVFISDIETVESYTKTEEQNIFSKSGYDIVPFVSNFYSSEFDKIAFYAEVYNTNKSEKLNNKFALRYYIAEENSTEKPLSDYSKIFVKDTSEVQPILNAFNIKELMTGNYYVVIEVRDQKNQLIVQKKERFTRNKSIKQKLTTEQLANFDIAFTFVTRIENIDSLNLYIRSLHPIATDKERMFIDDYKTNSDTIEKQRFLYYFWLSRYPSKPERAWLDYKKNVHYVNKEFATSIMPGFSTDRGRVYLQYGKPDQIVDVPHEPNAYPYQIWHYYQIKQFTNRRFVFYMPGIATNIYELLHSDMRGETQNQQWQLLLHRTDHSNPNPGNNFGDRSEDLFELPR